MSKFSLFHGERKRNAVNLSRVATSFMQKVTSNYLKNLKKAAIQSQVSQGKPENIEDNGKKNMDSKDAELEPRKLDNGDDDLMDNINMIEDDKKSPTNNKENESEYNLQPLNPHIELENDFQAVQEDINQIDETKDKTENNDAEDLATVNTDTLEGDLDLDAITYGDNIAFFDIPLLESDKVVQFLPMEAKTVNIDFAKSTYELEQENGNMEEDKETDDYIILLQEDSDVIKAVNNHAIPRSDFMIGQEPPKTDHNILEKISIDLKEGEDSITTTTGKPGNEEDKDVKARREMIKETKKIEEKEERENDISGTFGSSFTVFDTFGGESFANPRFKIPSHFKKFLDEPPAWLNSNSW